MKNKPLDAETERDVAALTHALVIDGIARRTNWTIKELVFQGGTSLALAWNSPRFSEDLDFVVAKGLNLSDEMRKVARHVEEGLMPHYPGARLDLKDKVRPEKQNGVFYFDVVLAGVLGNVKVKAEFWQVDPEKVIEYQGTYSQIDGRCNVKPMFAVATPEQLYIDKINAIANRDRLKWRDLFDLWFLKTQQGKRISEKLDEPEKFVEMLEACASLYDKTARDAIDGLQRFTDKDTDSLVELAETQLKPWLPDYMWSRIWPDTVREMAVLAKTECERIAELIDDHAPRLGGPR